MSLKRCAIVAIASIAVATATSVPAIAMEEVTDTVEKNYTNELLDKSLLEAKEADENSDSPVNNYFYTLTVPESINLHNTDKGDIGTGVYNNNDACKVNIRGNVLPNQIVTVAVSDAILHRNGSKDVAAKVDTSSKTVWNYDDLTAGELGTTDTEPTGTTTVYPVSAALTPGDWSGTIAFKCTLETLPRIDEFVVGLEPTSFEYDGAKHSPKLVFAENAQLEAGTDYVISGDVAKSEEGNYSITITGKGKYACSVTYEWSIIKRDIADYVVGLDKVSFEEDGTIHIPNIVWKDGVSLVESTDYTVSGTKSSSKSGDYVISIIGKGKYKGTTSLNWRINEKSDVSKIILGLSPDHFDYDGTEKAPELMFAEGYKNLEKDIDYTVSGNTSATDNGDYTLTVKGIGRCKGTVQFKWEIRELIPVGGTYTVYKTEEVLVGDGKTVYFPMTCAIYDEYIDDEYRYYQCGGGIGLTISVIDKTKTTYSTVAIRDHLCNVEVKSLSSTFAGCKNMTKTPVIPDSVADMNSTFSGCTSLTEAPVIPDSVTNMSSTFYGCTSLTETPVIPDSVTNMYCTFFGCKSLTKAPVIPDGVINVDRTFYNCRLLAEASTIPGSVTSMAYTFYYCTSLVKMPLIPDDVKDMCSTFEGCRLLTEISSVPDGVKNMRSTFAWCSSLKKAPIIPNSVENMEKTFYNCASLEEPPVIPNSVKNMASTFEGCKSLGKAPIIGNCVTNMDSAFYNCSLLVKAPVIPDSVTNMSSTFYGCTSLTEAPVIPDSVTNIAAAFNACTSLTEAPVIPDSVTNMSSTFYGCTSLKTYTGSTDSDGDFSNFIIPEGVISMDFTFYNCANLTEAPGIPESVMYLSYTFKNCSKLKAAPLIPNNVRTMNETFYGCRQMTVAPSSIPDSVTSLLGTFTNSGIETYAGSKDETGDFTNYHISNSITSLSGTQTYYVNGTFAACNNMVKAPRIPDQVVSMYGTFNGCRSLVEAPIIQSSVQDMRNIFDNCTALEGTLTCNANPTSYSNALRNTKITAVEGSCSDETKANLMATIGTTKNQMVANEQEVVLEKTLIDDEVSSVSTESKACDDADESSDNNQPAASEAIISDSSDIVQEADSSTCLPSIETKNTATQPSGE